MLGEAAFSDSDQLVLTRMPRRGPNGRPLDGRAELAQPVVLNLLAGPEGCMLRLAPTSPSAAASGTPEEPARSTALPACTCVALSR